MDKHQSSMTKNGLIKVQWLNMNKHQKFSDLSED
jgi:hypothetical protein